MIITIGHSTIEATVVEWSDLVAALRRHRGDCASLVADHIEHAMQRRPLPKVRCDQCGTWYDQTLRLPGDVCGDLSASPHRQCGGVCRLPT